MITQQELKELERKSVVAGVSMLQLMTNAGKGVFKILDGKVELKNKMVLVVCYHGNNGGDGFVAANALADTAEVTVLFIGDEEKLRKEAEACYKKMEHNPTIQIVSSMDEIDFDEFDIIIDAMLGTGVSGPIEEPISSAIERINAAKGMKVSVDIPTGLNPDTGEIADKAVNADLIVTFHDMKPGLVKYEDKTVVVDIGIHP